MTIPTNIPETPMAHSDYESVQESKEDSTWKSSSGQDIQESSIHQLALI